MSDAIQMITPLPTALMGINDYRAWARFVMRLTVSADRVRVELVELIGPGEDKVHGIVTQMLPSMHKSHYDVCPGCGLRDCDAETYRQRQREHHNPASHYGATGESWDATPETRSSSSPSSSDASPSPSSGSQYGPVSSPSSERASHHSPASVASGRYEVHEPESRCGCPFEGTRHGCVHRNASSVAEEGQ